MNIGVTTTAISSATAVTAVLLSSGGEHDEWEGQVFEALSRTPSHAHLHFVLPPVENLSLQLCNSLSASFGAFTGVLPHYVRADDVVGKLAAHLASSGRGWSWAESPSVLMRAEGARGKPRSVIGAYRRPIYGGWLRVMGYQPVR